MMTRVDPTEMGVWEVFSPDAKEGQLYKFVIYTAEGRKIYKSDPYATTCELRPGTASIIYNTDKYIQ